MTVEAYGCHQRQILLAFQRSPLRPLLKMLLQERPCCNTRVILDAVDRAPNLVHGVIDLFSI